MRLHSLTSEGLTIRWARRIGAPATIAVAAASLPLAAAAEPSSPAPAAEPVGGPSTVNVYGGDYTGGDFTRPENNFESRFEYKTSGSSTRTDEGTLILRRDGVVTLSPEWKIGWIAELPVVSVRNTAQDPAESTSDFGIGDVLFQAQVVRVLDARWAVGVGARLVAPTGEGDLGSGKWQVMPGFGFRYSFLEFGSNTYFVFKMRYAMSVAGDPSRRNISEPQISPMLNIGLPDRWFVSLFPSYDIRLNYGDPKSGQTGRLFLPFDVMVGRKLADNFVMSLEVAAPIINDYPVYRFKTELRAAIEF